MKIPEDFRNKYFLFAILVATAVSLPSLWVYFFSEDVRWISLSDAGSFFDALQRFFSGNLGGHSGEGGLYRPLSLLSFYVDHRLFGLNPFGYHLVNSLLNIVATCLVFSFSRKVFSGDSMKAFLVSAIFALHPIHTYSVYWISARADLLCATFYLAGLLAMIFYIENGKTKNLVLCGLMFFASLLSKEMGVSAPVIAGAIMLAIPQIGNAKRKWVALFAGAIVPVVIYLALRFLVLGSIIGGGEEYPAMSLKNIPSGIARSIGFLFFPFGHEFFEGFLNNKIAIVLCAALTLIVFLFIVILSIKRDKRILLFGLCVALSLAPMLGLAMRWHFYLPSVFLTIFLVTFISIIKNGKLRGLVFGLLALLFLAGSIKSGQVWLSNSQFNKKLVEQTIEIVKREPDKTYYLLAVPSKINGLATFTNGLDVTVDVLGNLKTKIYEILPAVHRKGYESCEIAQAENGLSLSFKSGNSYFMPRSNDRSGMIPFGSVGDIFINGGVKLVATDVDANIRIKGLLLDFNGTQIDSSGVILIYKNGNWEEFDRY